MVYDLFNNVDHDFAVQVAEGIGIEPPEEPGDELSDHDRSDPSLSMDMRQSETIETRKIAVLLDDGFDNEHVEEVTSALEEEGARVNVVSKVLGEKTGTDGDAVETTKSHVTTESVLFDAILIPGGSDSVDALKEQGDAKHFVAEAFKHKKPIGALSDGIELLEAIGLPDVEFDGEGLVSDQGVVIDRDSDDIDSFVEAFVEAIAQHRHWEREPKEVAA